MVDTNPAGQVRDEDAFDETAVAAWRQDSGFRYRGNAIAQGR